MTLQGSPYARFRRALDTGNPTMALAAASELNSIGLTDALELCLVLLVLRDDPRRFGPAVVRWHGRYVHETRGVSLGESLAVLALLGSLNGPRASEACHALADLLAGRRGFERAGEALVRAAMLREA
jgi:hypothetical protein